MNYNIKGTNVAISQELRDYVERRLGKLEHVLHDKDAARFDIELEYQGSQEKMYRAECMLHDPKLHATLRAEARADTLHESIDRLENELLRELSHTKQKHLRTLRHSAKRAKDILRGWRRP